MGNRVTAIFTGVLLLGTLLQLVPAHADTDTDRLRVRVRRLVPGLTIAEAEQLIIEGELAIPYGLEPGTDVSSRLAPAYRAAIRSDLQRLEPKIGVEVLFLVDSPESVHGVDAQLFTTLQSFSTMEGIEYYSASRDRMRTLFHESYVIPNPENRERLPDPLTRTLPEQDRIYVFQRDSSFGENVLELTYTASESAIRLRMRNLTQMYYMGFIPAVGPQELGMNLVVYPLGDKLLFYGNSGARPISLLGMESRVQRSFYNRLVALYDWFIGQTS
jgi:hypothetical protein